MKNLTISIALVISALYILSSCQSDRASTNQKTKEFPTLIDRNPKLQVNDEWSNVQNTYVALRENIKSDPAQVKSRIRMSQLFIQEARVTGEHGHYYPAALQMLDAILESTISIQLTKDERFSALSTKAGVLLSLHQFNKALEVGQEALNLNQYNAQIRGVLVDAFVELGKYDLAVEMADEMVSIRPDLRSYARVSYLREIHGDVEGSIEAMEMAVQAGFPPYEETAWASLTLGGLYERYGESEKAEILYHQILENRPDYPFAIGALANLEKLRGNYGKSQMYLDEACSIIPEVSFYVTRAELLMETGEMDAAKEVLKEVFVMLEDDVASGHRMDMEYAHIYSDLLNQPEKALEYLTGEYERRPANIDVNKKLAAVYLKLGDPTKAANHFEAAARTSSVDPELIAVKMELEGTALKPI